jgi:hypothetical protein
MYNSIRHLLPLRCTLLVHIFMLTIITHIVQWGIFEGEKFVFLRVARSNDEMFAAPSMLHVV